MGNSTTLEIGYAFAKGKKIYALQPDEELGRDVIYNGYARTPKALLRLLKGVA